MCSGRAWATPERDRAKVWDLVDGWAEAETDDKAKAGLRERIRRFAFTHSGHRRGLDGETRYRARAAYEKLEPRDIVVRHAWLFADQWVHESADEIEGNALDYAERAKRIASLRTSAMGEIWSERGFEGVTALLSGGGAPDIVGYSLGRNVTDAKTRVTILRQFLSIDGDLENEVDGCMRGLFRSIEGEARDEALSSAAEGADADRIVRLFRCTPFGQDTWRLLDRYGDEIRDRYWRTVSPPWNRYSDEELNELIDRLLEAKRPRTAFSVAGLDWPRIETSRLKRLLFDAGTVDAESEGHYGLEPYQISEALDSLDGRTGVTSDEMERLEFMYIEALDHSKHGIAHLGRRIAGSPIFFVQTLELAFKRDDDEQGPSGWRVEAPERGRRRARAAYRLLGRINRIPGTTEDGKIDTEALFTWVTETRRLCAEYGRVKIGDQYIGRLLAKAPAEEDNSWPCLPVCEAMERIDSHEIGGGFDTGVRGAGWRAIGKGGVQERDLAVKYRRWAKQRAFEYPRVGAVLESIAASYEGDAKWHDNEAKVDQRLER